MADPLADCLQQIKDYGAFEQLCNHLMFHVGYLRIEPLGGVHDAGRDAIYQSHDERTKITIFAYSVRRDWQRKLFEDAAKVRRNGHRCSHFIFVCVAKTSAAERDAAVNAIRKDFGWSLDLYSLDRIRLILADRPDVLDYYPQIFPPHLFSEKLARSPSWKPPKSRSSEGEEREGLFVEQSVADELGRLEADSYDWLKRTRSFHFQRLFQTIREIEHPAGRIEANRTVHAALRASGALSDASAGNMFQLCEELDASRLFQSNWKIRRMFARVVADILASQSDRRGQKLAHRFCEPRLHTPQGILLLAEAATEHTRAAAKIGASTLRQLLSSRQPQVVWQLLKHWGRVSPILPAGVTLGDVINSDSALIRRRLLLTRLMKDRTSLSALRKLLREVNNLTEGKLATSSDVRFGNALVAWAELNTSIVVPTKRSPKFPLLRARDILSLNKHADHDVDFNARVAEAIELDCIERDQSRGVYHFHPNESFSEGRYGYTRNHVRRAISIVPRDRLGGLLEELLRCADEGVRWAVAAELQCWWVRLSEREIAVDIVFRLVEDEHPWIIREILQQLAKDPSLCDSLNPSSLILSAKTSRQAMSSAGWQIGELDSAMKRIGIASDAGD